MAKAGSNSTQQIAMSNLANRTALLATAPRMRKNVGTYAGALGGTTRVKLFNVGVITNLLIKASAVITIGTAVASISAKGPYNLIQRVRLTDYDGTDRVNVSGFQLYLLNSVRAKQPFGTNNQAGANVVLQNPVVPTAVAQATLSFFLNVPLAFDADNDIVQLQDLRGSILAQTAVGELYLNVDWTNTLYANGDVDAVYSGGATSTVTLTGALQVQVWQDYLFPQAIGSGGNAVPLPMVDLMTVYELAGYIRSSDNLAANAEKLINYPNVRSVIGFYCSYVSATALSNNIAQLRLIANGNNILMDNTYDSQLLYQRTRIGSDLTAGTVWRLHREKPIETALYGNVQMGFTPSVVGANPYVELMFESFYTKGAALPGVQTS